MCMRARCVFIWALNLASKCKKSICLCAMLLRAALSFYVPHFFHAGRVQQKSSLYVCDVESLICSPLLTCCFAVYITGLIVLVSLDFFDGLKKSHLEKS